MTRRRSARDGFSLLEVILAVAILFISLAALSELVRIGIRSARSARDLSEAQLLCESKMSELAAGMIALEPVQDMPCDELLAEGWYYALETEPCAELGMLTVKVSVYTLDGGVSRSGEFTLTRWLPDGTAAATAAEAEAALVSAAEANAASEATSAASSSSSSSSSGSAGSGS